MTKEQIKDIMMFYLLDGTGFSDEVKYIAIDENGIIMGYVEKPHIGSTRSEWQVNKGCCASNGQHYIDVGVAVMPYEKLGFDWKDSLIKL